MAKRFISTELISEDWYLMLSSEVKLFFIYATLRCDHAGFLKVNLRAFNALHETQLTPDQILSEVNEEKERFRVITERLWLLEDFIPFQYGSSLNPNNRVHRSILDLLEKNGVSLGSIKGLNRGLIGVKDKDKDKDRDKDTDISYSNASAKTEIPNVVEIHTEMNRWLTAQGISITNFNASELAEKFHNHYDAQGWLRSNGMPIYKWQPLVNSWMVKEKSRILKEMNSAKSATDGAKKTEKKWHKNQN